MNKIAVVYWSGTGNTAAMADAIGQGAQEAGSEVSLMTSAEFSAARLSEFDVIAFGCPAMGAETLEECEFEPMFAEVEGSLAGNKIALFGSYGWGDGQWMRDWSLRCANADLFDEEGLMANNTPSDNDLDACRDLGRKLAAW
jgi:flavodoxin short chain